VQKQQKKKKWVRPLLIALVRVPSKNAVLGACKMTIWPAGPGRLEACASDIYQVGSCYPSVPGYTDCQAGIPIGGEIECVCSCDTLVRS
jgi:hypothetical protein